MSKLFSFALGIPGKSPEGQILDCFFPAPVKLPEPSLSTEVRRLFVDGTTEVTPEVARQFAERLPPGQMMATAVALAGFDAPLLAVRLDEDAPIRSTAEAYLKLHLLSHRLALPNSLNLENIFVHLPNVAWTSEGPVTPDSLLNAQLHARALGRHLEVFAVDKFPRMTNYVIPSGVRIADASRIRLGAYLGDGTYPQIGYRETRQLCAFRRRQASRLRL